MNIDNNLVAAVISVMVLFIICFASIKMRVNHVLRRRLKRKCRDCGGYTRRRYQMIHLPGEGASKSRFWLHYEWHIFDCCESNGCQLVAHVRHGRKNFDLIKIAWRYLTNPGQFHRDESLFYKARLIGEIIEPLEVRMRKYAEIHDMRARHFAESAAASAGSHVAVSEVESHTKAIQEAGEARKCKQARPFFPLQLVKKHGNSLH